MKARVAVVCDGMGGLVDGAEAASEAISALLAALIMCKDRASGKSLRDAIMLANETVYRRFGGDGGTTLTCVFATPRDVWAAHVGDSRLYAFDARNGLTLLSTDDTIRGAIAAHQGGGNEDSLDNRLLQFVGIGNAISPHVFPLSYQDHGLWILTSDGAHGIGRKALEDIAHTANNPADAVRKLIYVAEALGTRDNASAVCLDAFVEGELFQEPSEWTSLSLWLPGRGLEIWLAGAALQEDIRLPAGEAPIASTQAASKGRPRNRAKRTAAASKPRMKKAPAEEPPRTDQPLIRVLFEQDPHNDD